MRRGELCYKSGYFSEKTGWDKILIQATHCPLGTAGTRHILGYVCAQELAIIGIVGPVTGISKSLAD